MERTREEVRLVNDVSNMILELVNEARFGELEDMDTGDIDGTCIALAANIIKVVKEETK